VNKTEIPEEEMMFLLTFVHGFDIEHSLPTFLASRRVGLLWPEAGSSRQRLIVDGVTRTYLDGEGFIHAYERVVLRPISRYSVASGRKFGTAYTPKNVREFDWIVYVD
jgi:hypothetical protein